MLQSPLPVGDGHGWPSVAEDMDIERRQKVRDPHDVGSAGGDTDVGSRPGGGVRSIDSSVYER